MPVAAETHAEQPICILVACGYLTRKSTRAAGRRAVISALKPLAGPGYGRADELPNGTEVSESGFETKAAALIWGRDQEARIRE
jgi:hypothetical protein